MTVVCHRKHCDCCSDWHALLLCCLLASHLLLSTSPARTLHVHATVWMAEPLRAVAQLAELVASTSQPPLSPTTAARFALEFQTGLPATASAAAKTAAATAAVTTIIGPLRREYLLVCSHSHLDFRIPELGACAWMAGFELEILAGSCTETEGKGGGLLRV
jgi:hypothetical protein